MTDQEIFDTALNGIVKQGSLSRSRLGDCYYRHPKKPLACGVGHLLDDATANKFDKYQDQCGNSSITALPIEWIPNHLRLTIDLLSDIQYAHDDCPLDSPETEIEHFIENMKIVARNHGLEFNLSETNPQGE